VSCSGEPEAGWASRCRSVCPVTLFCIPYPVCGWRASSPQASFSPAAGTGFPSITATCEPDVCGLGQSCRTPPGYLMVAATSPDIAASWGGLVFLCSYIVLFGVTQWIEVARGFSALAAGLLLLPMTVVSGLVVPPISARNLVRGPLIWAALACLAAGVLTLFLSSAAWLFLTVLVTILLGIAIGAASSNQLALYEQADPEALGRASGLMRSFGYLGSIASSAVIGIVFRQRVTDTGVAVIAVVMIGASIALLLVTMCLTALLAKRQPGDPAVPGRPDYWAARRTRP
jgi:MFS family permease